MTSWEPVLTEAAALGRPASGAAAAAEGAQRKDSCKEAEAEAEREREAGRVAWEK
jgi:hypothetical protein